MNITVSASEFDTEELLDALSCRSLDDDEKRSLREMSKGSAPVQGERPDNCIVINGEWVVELTTLDEIMKVEEFIKTLAP